MAVDDDTTPPAGGRGGESWLGPKGSRKRTSLQIGIALLGLLLAFLLYRSNRAARNAGVDPTAAANGYPPAGGLGGAIGTAPGTFDGAGFSDLFAGLGQQISGGFAGEQTALAGLRASLAGTAATHTGPTALDAHQQHLAHLQHVANQTPTAQHLSPHQLHLLHLEHLAHTGTG